MTMVEVEIDIEIEDYLDEIDSDVLERELRRRRSNIVQDPNGPEAWTPRGMAHDLRTAFYARNASRFEMLLLALEPHEETVGLKRVPLKAEAVEPTN
jgi:hypothetical protein